MKEELDIDTTFDPPWVSLDYTFKVMNARQFGKLKLVSILETEEKQMQQLKRKPYDSSEWYKVIFSIIPVSFNEFCSLPPSAMGLRHCLCPVAWVYH